MADITRWDPFAEMASLRQTMDRLFDEARPWRIASGGNGADNVFPIDLLDTNDEVVVKASLPQGRIPRGTRGEGEELVPS